VEQEKERESIEKDKKELVEGYEKDLDEIFKHKNSNLTFDEIEKLVDEKMDTARSDVIEKFIEKGQEKKSQEGIEPEETYACACGTEATLCRDDNGKVEIFERAIQTKRGHVKTKEIGYYCSKCRKVFFPSKERA
jgi:hypothetical protein